jgi:intracellular multiplication protein IcmT
MDEMQGWHWRNTMKPARFFRLDARAGALWVLVLIHFRKWTILMAFVVSVIFILLERRGLTFESALRSLRTWIIGRYRPGIIWTSKRKFKDTGSV